MTETRAGPAPLKRLGQHFLKDQTVIRRIIGALNLSHQTSVIEIGPGQGALTLPLWEENFHAYYGIELDTRCVEFLTQHPSFQDQQTDTPRLHILHQDVLKHPLHTMPGHKVIVSNLPYNISTQILCNILPYLSHFQRCVLMFQREVADRILAQPNTSSYGRLAVMAQAVARVQLLCHVKPGAFFPPPKVDSSVLVLTPLENPWVKTPEAWFQLEGLVRHLFQQRRKQLRNTLKTWCPLEKSLPILEEWGIHLTQRPETLTLSQFVGLSAALVRTNPQPET